MSGRAREWKGNDSRSDGRGDERSAIPESRASSSSVASSGTTVKRMNEGGERNASKILTRGAVRGNRPIVETYRTRPVGTSKKGTTGTPIQLTANYFTLAKKPQFSMNQYRVDFSPDIEASIVRKALLREHSSMFGGYIFDGTCMFTSQKLDQDLLELTGKRNDDSHVKITIKHVREIPMTDGQSMQILNLVLRKAMEGLNLQLVGRNFFDAASKIDLRDFKLQLWPGYVTSIRQHEQEILLCCEIAHKVMRMETTIDILRNMASNMADYKTAFAKEIIGATVLTMYNNKTYRVDDIDWNSNPMSTFDTKSGKVTYVNYYKKHYNIDISDLKQPLLISKSKARDLRGGQSEMISLIPELCRATGLTDRMRGNFNLMRAMAAHTRLDPRGRAERLLNFNRRLQDSRASSDVMAQHNLALDRQLVRVGGRMLLQEKMLFGLNKSYQNGVDADWTRGLRNCNMYHSVDLLRWCIIYPSRDEQDTKEFIKHLKQACSDMQYKCGEPKSCAIPNDRTETYLRELDKFLNMDPKLVMFIFPSNRTDLYAAIKKRTCVDRAVASQVVLAKTIKGGKGGLMSIATKISIQLNCKLGGAPWMINMPPLSGLMTIGFDVCHDTRDKSKSYGALVASMDLKKNVEFFSAVSAHKNGEELSNTLVMNVNKALLNYRSLYGCLPQRILFYRDGVGDGQIEYVHSHEVELLKKKLNEIYADAGQADALKFCFIIVNKRLNTRLFNNGNNPGSGTIVDDVITLPERYDFYMISQTVRQGTVSPTSYNIISDNMGLPADKLQQLTYKFCHLYYNWSGTTRVPAVCQYAHKLAFLVGNYLHQAPSNALERKLYFL